MCPERRDTESNAKRLCRNANGGGWKGEGEGGMRKIWGTKRWLELSCAVEIIHVQPVDAAI